MARPNLVPGPGQAKGCWQAVLAVSRLSAAWGSSANGHSEVAVEVLSEFGTNPRPLA